jgi:hypothetical protein
MYSQLNTLAASLAPTYTDAGYMAGTLHKLTVGNYVYEQWGILNNLSFEIIEDSPWEITPGSQLPLYIRVSGIKFTPIHNFRPESQFNNTNNKYIKQHYSQISQQQSIQPTETQTLSNTEKPLNETIGQKPPTNTTQQSLSISNPPQGLDLPTPDYWNINPNKLGNLNP